MFPAVLIWAVGATNTVFPIGSRGIICLPRRSGSMVVTRSFAGAARSLVPKPVIYCQECLGRPTVNAVRGDRDECQARSSSARQSSSAAHPTPRYFQLAANAVRSKRVVDGTAKLIWNDVADHGSAISGRIGFSYRATADLLPLDHQFAM